MSCFAELSPQLLLIGNALRTGLILGGTSYLQDLLLPMNLSDQWLEAAAGQARRRQAAGLAGQRRLRPAEPDGVLPRLPAADAAALVDHGADHDPERRVRLPDAARPARNPARRNPRQLAGDHSEGLSRLHAREGGADGRSAGALRRGRAGRALAGQQVGHGLRRKSPAASSRRFPPATIICAPFPCQRTET